MWPEETTQNRATLADTKDPSTLCFWIEILTFP